MISAACARQCSQRT